MKPDEHPLTTQQALAAFAVAALFWGVGVTLIDPRTGLGVLLCLVGIAGTAWIFWSSLKLIPNTSVKDWPWLGLVLLVIEVIIPTYMLAVKAESWPVHSIPAPPPAVSMINPERVEAPPRVAETSPSQSTLVDRVVVDITTEYLLSFHRNKTMIEGQRLFQPFIGKWIKVSGVVDDVAPPYLSSGSMTVVFKQRNVFMHFDEKLFPRVETLRTGQKISLLCQISRADRQGISLEHCEFQP